MPRFCCFLSFALVLSLNLAPAHAAAPELVSVQKIWDQGKHNAFTDLIRWRDRWYCTFRETDGHVGGDGQLRVLVSDDGLKWDSAALISEKGIDLRDPKLSITPDDRLMIVAGGSVYEGTKLLGRQPRVTFSKDGREWSAPQRVLSEGEWLWRVTWHDGKAYGVSYNASERATAAAKEAAESGKVDPGPADWKLKLVVSQDGVKYDVVTHLDVPGHPNETTLRFLPDGEMISLVRREGGNTFGWIGRSQAPYTEWSWKETKHRLGGPNFIPLPDGSLWAGSRSYPGGAKTVLARMTADGEYDPVLTLPSGGDTSYPGLVWHEGLLWMSYYASHEGKSAIYLAQIKLPLESAEKVGVRSGIQPGEPIATIFEPLNVTGPFAGELYCLVCENGANPVAMIFARELSEPLTRLITKVDAATTANRDREMGSFVVFLNNGEELPERLKDLGQKKSLRHIVLATYDPAGPDGFQVNPEADVTVVLYQDHLVKANHAFRKGELSDGAIDKILDDLPKILAK
jgi:hypothetical protein